MDDHIPKGALVRHQAAPLRRAFGPADRDALAKQLGDPRVADWLAAVRQPFDADEAEEFLTFASDPEQRVFALEQDGTLIGGLCVGDVVWYWLAPAHWGQGHMTRTLHAALAERFRSPAPPLIATCREDNTASRRLLARIGFSPRPAPRRMFFHGAGRSFACRDYVLSAEQWHLLNPPRLSCPGSALTLRPARQTDLAAVQRLSEGAPHDGTWPGTDPAQVRRFLETHRFRGAGTALWIVEDDARSTLGMALCGDTAPRTRFACKERTDRLHREVLRLLGG